MTDRLKPIEFKGQQRVPTVAVCRIEECGFEWAVAYTPMPLDTWCGIAKRAQCPMCGDRKPLLKGNGDESTPDATITISA